MLFTVLLCAVILVTSGHAVDFSVMLSAPLGFRTLLETQPQALADAVASDVLALTNANAAQNANSSDSARVTATVRAATSVFAAVSASASAPSADPTAAFQSTGVASFSDGFLASAGAPSLWSNMSSFVSLEANGFTAQQVALNARLDANGTTAASMTVGASISSGVTQIGARGLVWRSDAVPSFFVAQDSPATVSQPWQRRVDFPLRAFTRTPKVAVVPKRVTLSPANTAVAFRVFSSAALRNAATIDVAVTHVSGASTVCDLQVVVLPTPPFGTSFSDDFGDTGTAQFGADASPFPATGAPAFHHTVYFSQPFSYVPFVTAHVSGWEADGGQPYLLRVDVADVNVSTVTLLVTRSEALRRLDVTWIAFPIRGSRLGLGPHEPSAATAVVADVSVSDVDARSLSTSLTPLSVDGTMPRLQQLYDATAAATEQGSVRVMTVAGVDLDLDVATPAADDDVEFDATLIVLLVLVAVAVLLVIVVVSVVLVRRHGQQRERLQTQRQALRQRALAEAADNNQAVNSDDSASSDLQPRQPIETEFGVGGDGDAVDLIRQPSEVPLERGVSMAVYTGECLRCGKESTQACVPCGHRCVCSACAGSTRVCPICDRAVTAYMTLA